MSNVLRRKPKGASWVAGWLAAGLAWGCDDSSAAPQNPAYPPTAGAATGAAGAWMQQPAAGAMTGGVAGQMGGVQTPAGFSEVPAAGAMAGVLGGSLPAGGLVDPSVPVVAEPEDLSKYPERLSETGLFADMATQALGEGVRYYAPQFQLWTDGAAKRRWVRLPPGTQIDTTDMDAWRYPVGTKIWKEFAKDGQVIETRYMAKYGPDGQDWVFIAYQWDPMLNDAFPVPEGQPDALGTQHDIPSDLTCLKCHEGLADGILGFSALQLSHDGDGTKLSDLMAEGLLTAPPPANLVLPGDEVEQQALGYLHANCGHCHNPEGGEAVMKNPLIIFWQRADELSSVEATSTYQNLVETTEKDLSLLVKSVDRMKSRPEKQMPPVGTDFVDDMGVAAVDAWVQRLLQEYPLEEYAKELPDLVAP